MIKLNIILADKSGFCFGVKRAVDESLKVQKKFNKKIYTLGPLIHNSDVVNKLKEKGIYPIEIDNIDNLREDDVVIIRSHGVPEKIFFTLKIKNKHSKCNLPICFKYTKKSTRIL